MFELTSSFQYPILFSLLIPLIGFLSFLYLKKNKITFFWPFKDLQSIYKWNSLFYKLKFILFLIISILIVLILAKPINKFSEEKIKKNGIDIEIVFDLSFSMVAQDLKPNRLEVWKKVLIDFIKSTKTDRIWIVLFSWKPFNSVPLSFDYNFLIEFIEAISIDTINQDYSILQWTAIWDSLILAIDSLKESKDREKVIILITDWEANRWLDPIIALKKAKEEEVKVYTIWVGWDETTYLDIMVWPFPKKIEIWGIDEETLKKIAHETNWKYYRANSTEIFKDIFLDISKLEKKDIEVELIESSEEDNLVFLYLLIFFFLLLLWLKYKKNI